MRCFLITDKTGGEQAAALLLPAERTPSGSASTCLTMSPGGGLSFRCRCVAKKLLLPCGPCGLCPLKVPLLLTDAVVWSTPLFML
jgi:hypothetical protein